MDSFLQYVNGYAFVKIVMNGAESYGKYAVLY